MRRIYVYSISLLLIIISSFGKIFGQDTIPLPLKIKIGLEASGPAVYFTDKNNFSTEGYVSADINEKMAWVIGAGYLNYKYSQYNYEYLSSGIFFRVGTDINLLKPEKSLGKYWAGIGLRYGISAFSSEVPYFKHDNYWGSTSSSIVKKTKLGHFIEVSPGVRAEVFRNLSIGWTVSLRLLVYNGTGKDQRPVYVPGFGNSTKPIATGLNYFIVLNIPYKKITIITKKEVPADSDEIIEPVNSP